MNLPTSAALAATTVLAVLLAVAVTNQYAGLYGWEHEWWWLGFSGVLPAAWVVVAMPVCGGPYLIHLYRTGQI